MQFYMAGLVSVLLGAYSLTLPHTPPLKIGRNAGLAEVLGFDTFVMFKRTSFTIFIVCMFLICVPLYFYSVNMSLYLTELGWTFYAAKMSFAQVSEIGFLICLPIMLSKLGYKKTIVISIFCWAIRYILLAGSIHSDDMQTAFIFTAILLHGVCYDFLFIAGILYVNEQVSERISGAAQGLIAFIIWGLGAFVGTYLAGISQAHHTLKQPIGNIAHNWEGIWIYPALGSITVLTIFILFFPELNHKYKAED